MADLWPDACRSRGWNPNDRDLRLTVLSQAVKRPIKSANDLNRTDDFDKVKAYLGFAADDIDATTETDHPEIGRARRLRDQIRDQVSCLRLYHPNPEAYLAKIVTSKFPSCDIDDLTDEPTFCMARSQPGPSELEQVLMAMARSIQSKRKSAGHTLHQMKTAAGIPCDCARCRGTKTKQESETPETRSTQRGEMNSDSQQHPVSTGCQDAQGIVPTVSTVSSTQPF